MGGLSLFDPFYMLSESFWLSALAVSIMLTWYHWFPLPARYRRGRRWLPLQLLHPKLGIMLLMAPLQVMLFEGISLSALAANLLAIPTITFISVPLILLAMLTPVGSLCAALWWLAGVSRGSGWWRHYRRCRAAGGHFTTPACWQSSSGVG
ncbi:DNA internalization-related competence protein ComEC/Rec2|nr:DNA internalization-related competence protein ComEC/Rec2 [Candidatus Pantoea persica]